jgi:hypothetical protein
MSDEIWKVYYPDEGETADDAVIVMPGFARRIRYAEDAAKIACEWDYGHRDGWERGQDTSFSICIISPDGEITNWTGRHELSVSHTVEEEE